MPTLPLWPLKCVFAGKRWSNSCTDSIDDELGNCTLAPGWFFPPGCLLPLLPEVPVPVQLTHNAGFFCRALLFCFLLNHLSISLPKATWLHREHLMVGCCCCCGRTVVFFMVWELPVQLMQLAFWPCFAFVRWVLLNHLVTSLLPSATLWHAAH